MGPKHHSHEYVGDAPTPTLEDELRKRKTDGKGAGRRKWLSIGGLTALGGIFLAIEGGKPLAGWLSDQLVCLSPVIEKHQGEISTLQKNAQDQKEWQAHVDEKLKALQESMKDQKTSLGRIEDQLSWQYGRPATIDTNRTK